MTDLARMTAKAVLDREMLEVRARLIEVAATLDRIARGEEPGDVADDPRLAKIREALGVLAEPDGDDRAARVQMIFSLPADDPT